LSSISGDGLVLISATQPVAMSPFRSKAVRRGLLPQDGQEFEERGS
jgi:hypothetical protein